MGRVRQHPAGYAAERDDADWRCLHRRSLPPWHIENLRAAADLMQDDGYTGTASISAPSWRRCESEREADGSATWLMRELVAVVGEFVAILHGMEQDNPAVLRGFLRVLRGQTYRSAASGLQITPQGLAKAVNRHCRHHGELGELIRTRRRPGRARFAVDNGVRSDER